MQRDAVHHRLGENAVDELVCLTCAGDGHRAALSPVECTPSPAPVEEELQTLGGGEFEADPVDETIGVELDLVLKLEGVLDDVVERLADLSTTSVWPVCMVAPNASWGPLNRLQSPVVDYSPLGKLTGPCNQGAGGWG